MKPIRRTLPLLLLTVVLAVAGCKAPHLEPGGAYAPTNAAGQVVSNDIGLALVDASYKFVFESIMVVFDLEKDNRLLLWNVSPNIKKELDRLRPKVQEINGLWARTRREYRKNPTPAGLTNLETILAELQRILPIVQQQYQPLNAAVAKAVAN